MRTPPLPAPSPSCTTRRHRSITILRSAATTESTSARPSMAACPHSATLPGTGTIRPLLASAQTIASGCSRSSASAASSTASSTVPSAPVGRRRARVGVLRDRVVAVLRGGSERRVSVLIGRRGGVRRARGIGPSRPVARRVRRGVWLGRLLGSVLRRGARAATTGERGPHRRTPSRRVRVGLSMRRG